MLMVLLQKNFVICMKVLNLINKLNSKKSNLTRILGRVSGKTLIFGYLASLVNLISSTPSPPPQADSKVCWKVSSYYYQGPSQ